MDSKMFAEFVRTATRPVLTLVGFAAWLVFIAYDVDYPAVFQWLVIAMCLEWFTERMVTRLAGLGK